MYNLGKGFGLESLTLKEETFARKKNAKFLE